MIQPASLETQLAYNELKQLATGETCSYERLEKAIGMDPQTGKGYRYVFSARRKVERELECVLECVSGEGIKRLPPAEVINRGGKDLRHVRRTVRVGMRRQITLAPIETSGTLTSEQQQKYLFQLSCFGILDAATRPGTMKRIESKVAEVKTALPTVETLALIEPRARKDKSA